MENDCLGPRLEGIEEQLGRAQFFLAEAKASVDSIFRFRHLIAAMYFARAVAELMLEAADKQDIRQSRDQLEAMLADRLPRYALVEKMRIHDFHRFGILQRPGMFVGGPITLTARRRGTAAITFGHAGIDAAVNGNARVVSKRPLIVQGNEVFDEEGDAYVGIEQVLTEYIGAIPSLLHEFRELAAN